MPDLYEMIRQYGDILAQERRLSERKEQLRTAIAGDGTAEP